MKEVTCDICGKKVEEKENKITEHGYIRFQISSRNIQSKFQGNNLEQLCEGCEQGLEEIMKEEEIRHKRRKNLRLQAFRYRVLTKADAPDVSEKGD
jgi:hypothetical protein